MLGNISMTCWRGLYCAGQGASWISKPQREQGVSRAAQRWYYSCFKDCKHVHQKQKCSESDKPVSLLASLCLAYLHFSHLKYHERLSPHSLSVSIQWTEISALAIWLAINKSKEPKDLKKKECFICIQCCGNREAGGKKRRTTVKLIYSKMLFDQIKKQREDSSTCFVEEWQ